MFLGAAESGGGSVIGAEGARNKNCPAPFRLYPLQMAVHGRKARLQQQAFLHLRGEWDVYVVGAVKDLAVLSKYLVIVLQAMLHRRCIHHVIGLNVRPAGL